MHPSTEAIIRWFKSEHLPEHLATWAKLCEEVALTVAAALEGPEVTAGLRKLLEAKDCFVRAAVAAKEN